MLRSFGRRNRGRKWRALALVALGAVVLAAVAGHAYGAGYSPLKPRFDHPSQRIRYHDGFHDGHSHDGYGHGYHGGNSGHAHDKHGQVVYPSYQPIVRPYSLRDPQDRGEDSPGYRPPVPYAGPRGYPYYTPYQGGPPGGSVPGPSVLR